MVSKDTEAIIQKELTTVQQFLEVFEKANKEKPKPEDMKALRRMLNESPELWRFAGDLAEQACLSTIEKVNATPAIKESMRRGVGALKKELGFNEAPQLERLLIEQVVMCWLRLSLAEYQYTNVMQQSITLTLGMYWEKRLSSAQRRYTRAIETLARVRKLSRTTPALQINIATEGGQQFNVADQR